MKYRFKSSKFPFYFFEYTAIFCIVVSIIYLSFIQQHHSLIWEIDGSKQHYPALAYLGIYFREFIKNLLTTGHLTLKMWDMTLGYGGDVLTTLNYYSFGDPLDLLSIFVPYRYTEYLYSFLVIFRIYLSGLSFSYYCKSHNHTGMHVLLGSLMYSFCGYTIIFATRHPFFINPMIYLPLLLIGIDRMLEGKRSRLFHVMVMISIISNFYFFYMLTIFMFFYALLRFFELNSGIKNKLALLRKSFLHCTLQYLLGVLNSAVIFLPVLISFFNTERVERSLPGNLLYYHIDYYKSLISSIFFSSMKNEDLYLYGTYLGFSLIAVISFILLFKVQKKFFTFKVLGIILFLFLLFPFFGYALNGFSYITNRWTFLLSFVLAYSFILVFDHFHFTVRLNRFTKLILLLIIITEISLKGFYNNSSLGDNQVERYYDVGTANDRLTNNSINSLKKGNNKSLYRFDVLDRESRNYGILNRIPTVSSYFSITSKYSSLFSRYLGNAGEEVTVSIGNFDSRSGLNILSGVKYVTETSSKGNHSIPFGYKKIKSKQRILYNGKKTSDSIYENKNHVGLFSVYDTSISENDFLKYKVFEREEIMLQSCVVDDPIPSNKNMRYNGHVVSDTSDTLQQIKQYIYKNPSCGVNIMQDGRIAITKPNASLSLSTKGQKNSEIYLYLEKATFIPNKHTTTFSRITAASSASKSTFECKTKNSTTVGIDTVLLNTGYQKTGNVNLSITFMEPGIYDFKNINIVYQNTRNYADYTNDLKDRKVKNSQFSGNSISADISVSESKILSISVPYSSGWTCTIDGKQTKIIRSNIMFMSVPLSKGTHKIVFKYRTPGLKVGLCITAITTLFCLIFYFSKHYKKRNRRY